MESLKKLLVELLDKVDDTWQNLGVTGCQEGVEVSTIFVVLLLLLHFKVVVVEILKELIDLTLGL